MGTQGYPPSPSGPTGHRIAIRPRRRRTHRRIHDPHLHPWRARRRDQIRCAPRRRQRAPAPPWSHSQGRVNSRPGPSGAGARTWRGRWDRHTRIEARPPPNPSSVASSTHFSHMLPSGATGQSPCQLGRTPGLRQPVLAYPARTFSSSADVVKTASGTWALVFSTASPVPSTKTMGRWRVALLERR